ncbi:MAG: hypothetical protein AAF378_06620 [Cyanobacteria bacterium P01_A01_bin.84]
MNQSNKINTQLQETLNCESFSLSESFIEAVEIVKQFVREEITKEVEHKQLYYHNHVHAGTVAKRSEIIFQEILPFWELIFLDTNAPDPTRINYLINICAIAHDMVQDFLPVTTPQSSRRRETGISEKKTAQKLITYIRNLNAKYPENSRPFLETDIEMISEAINATICVYEPQDESIYQPDLYDREQPISIAARIIALADLGGLGIEGIEAFFDEGILIFLEENPDLIPVIKKYFQDKRNYPEIDLQTPEYENLRQRLFRRSQFQLNFAKGRKNRLERELAGLPERVIQVLKNRMFVYLTDETIQEIANKTPKNPQTNLEDLVKFFHLEKYIQ